MSAEHDSSDRQGARRPAGAPEAPTYQGSRFPWWLTILYVGFAIFGFLYMARHYLPDLKSWLAR